MYFYIKFTLFTSKVRIIYDDFDFTQYEYKQSIYATWHGRVMIMPIINPSKLPSSAIVSDHNDGRLIGGVIKNAGVKLIFGSSNRRRITALKEIMDFIKQGYNFLITPDGPRGPAREIDGAIINIASSSGLPIIPGSCSSKHAKFFNSWDNFMLPLPFSEIVIVFTEPLIIPKSIAPEEKEKYNIILQGRLNKATDLADKYCHE
ncbi:MAG: lysophospholipid acyltransferase family protein [Pseudomonadota bacterium]